MPQVLFVLGTAFAAVCIWLTIRIVNRRERWAMWSLASAVLLAFVVSIGPCYGRRYNSCAICRLGRFDYSCLGSRWSTFEETACTAWYRQNVAAAHEHLWVSGSTYTERNIFGSVVLIADGNPRALFRITPSQQVSIYKQFGDAKEAERLFRLLASDNGQGNYEQRRKMHFASVRLRDWAESDFAESPDEIEQEIAAEGMPSAP